VSDRARRLALAAAAAAAGLVIGLIGVEAWVRLTWDVHRGTPGFYVPDATRGQRLSEDYSGWFAGVPVRINRLGLRDPREYDPDVKQPNTFRILLLGDSVCFGHGSVYEHTYPYLLEQRLRAWRPAIDWQVWNAAVPGYNTSQELAQLLEVGPRFNPDLVIVAFYENDILDNHPVPHPTRLRRAAVAAAAFVRRHVWSLEFYRRLYYTLRWRLTERTKYERRLEALAQNESAEPLDATSLPAQQLSPYEWLSDEFVASHRCTVKCAGAESIAELQRDPGYSAWLDAVHQLQALDRAHRYNVMFFIDVAPRRAQDGDYFTDWLTRAFNRFLLDVLGDGTGAVSVHDGFLHTRPSQMPNAGGHSLGNANDVKARILFDYLRDRVPGAGS
jgi:GDSL-like Lipase/Acylhydrolase family